LRRIVFVVTAVAVLVAASSAYGAINAYTAPMKFAPKKSGSAKKPVAISFTQNITASGTNGNRTAVLQNIRTKIYGLRVNGKNFPTCSLSKIAAAKNDNVCPKGAKVAGGAITALLGPSNNFDLHAMGVANCDPALDVWNSGQGKLTFFFVDTPTHICLGGALHTGSTGPYPATYKMRGKYLITNVPIPDYIDFPLGKSPTALAGSLVTEHLVWFKHTTKVKVKGKKKTVAAVSSVGCKKHKRPYSTAFSAVLPTTGTHETQTISGSAKCR
jgi:hypothetical protein